MAEKLKSRTSPTPLPRQRSGARDEEKVPVAVAPSMHPDCPVCLQPSIHPVKLPCTHVFCFLCVKGASNQNRRCALCRQPIPPTFFDDPTLLEDPIESQLPSTSGEKDRYAWFYEGRNGWWQYDERTNLEIEEGYRSKKRSFELLIAGYMYIIDLDNMSQMRRLDPSRRRRIKRDLVTAPKKGIAGLKLSQQGEQDGATNESDADGGSEQSSPPLAPSSDGSGSQGVDHLAEDTVGTSDGSHEQAGDHLSQELESLSLVSADTVQEESNPSEGNDRGETSDDDGVIHV